MTDLHPMEKGEEQETFNLIMRVFQEHVAPVYSKNGMRFTPMRKFIKH
ncbi:MAG: hypothetical protein GY710_20270 [Desulfobacteraceae bacterium]|nr:hypothetical protein [Desulfobacteraceae bacterium]